MSIFPSRFMEGPAGPASEAFPNPFLDVASTAVPHSMRNALYWCEYIFSMMGTYRMAMERVISYFQTEVEFSGQPDETQERYGELFDQTLDFFTVEQNLLRDRACYGNGFASFVVPFQRFLTCPRCGSSFTLETVYNDRTHFAFEWASGLEFVARCPKGECGFRGPWRVDDRVSDDERKLKLRTWSPHEIELLHDPFSHDVAHLWRIPEDYKTLVRQGHLFHLERVPMPVLRAIRTNSAFRFAPDAVFHMKEPTLSGIRNRGWGLPRILTNFRQLWYVQVLRRMNEAIALDYVIPLRIITPEVRAGAAGGTGGDPLAMFHGGDARSQITGMLRRRRRNPAAWQVLPFPVKYNMMGGDANMLAPRDLLDQGYEMLLNDAGTPVELYKGSLSVQAAPPALRLFEATWHHMVHDANAFLRWAVRQSSQILGWEPVEAKHKKVTVADDIQRSMAVLQLMASQMVSGTTGLKTLGLDKKQEDKLIAEEAMEQAELQARTQEEMAQAGFAQQLARGQLAGPGGGQGGGQAGAGGGGGQGGSSDVQAPPPPVDQYLSGVNPNSPQTPQDMLAVADSLAQELLGQPESVKDSQLRKLKQTNEALHAMVRARMDSTRRQAQTQGGAMLMQQQYGGGGGAPAQ